MRIKVWAAGAVVTLASAGLVANGVGASASDGSTGRGWPVKAGSAASAPVSQEITAGRTIKLNGKQTNGKEVNVDGSRIGPGDYFVFEETLRNYGSDKVVGRDSVQCMINFTTYMCHGTFILYGQGTIEVSGVFTRGGNDAIAVTGGSGNFQNVRGELHVGGPRGVDLTLHLIP